MRVLAVIIVLLLFGGQTVFAAVKPPAVIKDTDTPVIFARAKLVITPKPEKNGDTGGRELDYIAEIERGREIFPTGVIIENELADNEAVAFIFEHSQIADLNLKNVYVSRDIFFVNERGDIVDMIPKIPVRSSQKVSSVEKVKMVVELAPGSAKKYNIRIGDKVEVINPE